MIAKLAKIFSNFQHDSMSIGNILFWQSLIDILGDESSGYTKDRKCVLNPTKSKLTVLSQCTYFPSLSH